MLNFVKSENFLETLNHFMDYTFGDATEIQSVKVLKETEVDWAKGGKPHASSFGD